MRLIDADVFIAKLSRQAELLKKGEIREIDINLLILSIPTVDIEELISENEKLKADNFLFYQEQKKDRKIIDTLKLRINAICSKSANPFSHLIRFETAQQIFDKIKGISVIRHGFGRDTVEIDFLHLKQIEKEFTQ